MQEKVESPDRARPARSVEVNAERAMAEPLGRSGVGQVLALQRLAGNHAVASLLRRSTETRTHTTPSPPVSVSVQRDPTVQRVPTPPPVQSWSGKVKVGGVAKDRPRDLEAAAQKVYVGDQMTVSADFPALTTEQKLTIKMTEQVEGTCTYSGPTWVGNRATWVLDFPKVGALTMKFKVSGDLGDGLSVILGEHNEQFRVVTDIIDFILSVQAAHSVLDGKFSSATAHLNSAVGAFKKAQEDQQGVLNSVGKTDKLAYDLMWGAFWAAAGGFAGGAVGSVLKKSLEGLKDLKGPVADGFTDAGKDFVKFSVRSLDKMRGGTGKPSTSGDSTAPGNPAAKAPGAAEKAAGDEPLDFLTATAASISGDRVKVQAQLGQMIEAARAARAADSKADFDEDPSAVVDKPSQVDAIADGLTGGVSDYGKSLWQTWLSQYGYDVASGWDNAFSKNPHPLSMRSQPIRVALVGLFGSPEAAGTFAKANAPAPAAPGGVRGP